jgi:hypothetical protein
VSCHGEHQGTDALTAVVDGSCTTCHADLRTLAGPSVRYAHTVTDFASHPEFAALQQGRPDRARIRFNHAKHLPPAGLPGLDGRPVMLECASCHRPTPDGRYMEPIAFQAHCAGCHSNALAYDMARFRNSAIPHGVQPELLRGLIRERYTQFIRRNPAELKSEAARSPRPIPGHSSSRPTTEPEWTWVDLLVEKADHILFQSSSSCRYCHDVEVADGTWQIAPTKIPKRWFAHSRFSHFSHRLNPKRPAGQGPLGGQENCTVCHEFAGRSSKTDDVLMPSLRKCRECHDQAATSAERARTDCVACHIYHNEVGGRRPLDLTQLPDDQGVEVIAGCTRSGARLDTPPAGLPDAGRDGEHSLLQRLRILNPLALPVCEHNDPIGGRTP